jgi:hypothetical protein
LTGHASHDIFFVYSEVKGGKAIKVAGGVWDARQDVIQLTEKRPSKILSKEEPVGAMLPQEKLPEAPSETSKKDTISDIFQEQSGEKILTSEGTQESDTSPKETQPQIKTVLLRH